MSSTTTTSPNASQTSSEPSKDLNIEGRFISTQHHHEHASFVPIFGSSPSQSMQTTVFNTMIERLPMLEHGLNMPHVGGYFEATGPCFLESEVDNKGSYLENGVFGSVNISNIGVEGDMFVPPLENVSTCKRETNSSSFDDINSILNNSNIGISSSENKGGVENLFQQELAMGEWDFEELMKDASSFPFVDFSF